MESTTTAKTRQSFADAAPNHGTADRNRRSQHEPSLLADGRIGTEDLFALLSDGTRRRLLALLLDEREICVCRLGEAMDIPQSKISRHLAVLREGGLVVGRRQGTLILYRVDPSLAGWAVRVVSMMTEGARLEPYHDRDRERLAHAKPRGKTDSP